MRDSRTMTDQLNDCGDMEDLNEETKQKVRNLVCANAKGRSTKQKAADADEILQMLGLHPTKSPHDDDGPRLGPSPTLNHFV